MFDSRFFDPTALPALVGNLLRHLPVNLMMVAPALGLGIVLGLVLALARLSRSPIFGGLAGIFVSFFRGTPVLVQLYLAYFAIPGLLGQLGLNIARADPMLFVVVTLGLNQSAFLCEIFRSALLSVDRGQRDAALSVGFSPRQGLWRIILPQAGRIALPGLGNSVIILLHETALAFTLGVIDVMGAAQATALRTSRSLDSYVAAAIVFIALSLVLEAVFSRLSRGKGVVPAPQRQGAIA